MLELVAKGFRAAREALGGKTVLTEENLQAALRDIRLSLLEADVALPVVRQFLGQVKARALGEVVVDEVRRDGRRLRASPGDHFVKICHDELSALMAPAEPQPLRFRRPLTTIMMVGLQGSGKTTTCGKLATYLKKAGRRPLLVAADLARPAAVAQLETLGERVGVPVFSDPGLSVPALCRAAQARARQLRADVVVLDTAGRLAIDVALMAELEAVREATQPDNILFVCDAMAGQSAVDAAAEFHRRLAVTGFVMTKLDGDARGGAALSLKAVTGQPIRFLGLGEGLDKLEVFRAQGLASRILGMGDVVGLMRDFEEVVDQRDAEAQARKLLRGTFSLDDFLGQLRAIKKMGPVRDLLDKLPAAATAGAADLDDRTLVGIEALIQSMTPKERQAPTLIREEPRRAARIARGAGRPVAEVEQLVERFGAMRQMMEALGQAGPGGGLAGRIPGMRQLMGLKKLRGLAKQAGGPGMAGLGLGGGAAGGGAPQLPGMPDLAAMSAAAGLPGLPPGLAAGGAAVGKAVPVSAKARQKARDKRKSGRQARRRSRR